MKLHSVDPAALLTCHHVTCAYGETVVVSDVTFALAAGDFAGIVGPSGSGKTTLLKAILGSVTPVHGDITMRDGARLGYVPQVESVDWNFPVTVLEVIAMTRGQKKWWPRITPAERKEAEEVLDRLGLGGLGGRHIRELSGGQQQRVFVARALFHRPDILVLDEPTSGVDVRTRHEVLHLLADLHEQGMTVLLTTHDLNGLAAHLPRLVCLNKEIIADGSPREVLVPDVLERLYGAPMHVLEHGGMPVVLDHANEAVVRRFRGRAG